MFLLDQEIAILAVQEPLKNEDSVLGVAATILLAFAMSFVAFPFVRPTIRAGLMEAGRQGGKPS